jgi:hypothetical protein
VKTNFTSANLAGANLSGANIQGANVTSADLSSANVTGLDPARLALVGIPAKLPSNWVVVTDSKTKKQSLALKA